MVSLYRAAKAGKIDAQLIGRLTHILNSLVAIDREHSLLERIEAIERELGLVEARRRQPRNGHDRDEQRPS
jgi:hypothetical protein